MAKLKADGWLSWRETADKLWEILAKLVARLFLRQHSGFKFRHVSKSQRGNISTVVVKKNTLSRPKNIYKKHFKNNFV